MRKKTMMYMPAKMKREIAKRAKQEGISSAEFIRRAIDETLSVDLGMKVIRKERLNVIMQGGFDDSIKQVIPSIWDANAKPIKHIRKDN